MSYAPSEMGVLEVAKCALWRTLGGSSLVDCRGQRVIECYYSRESGGRRRSGACTKRRAADAWLKSVEDARWGGSSPCVRIGRWRINLSRTNSRPRREEFKRPCEDGRGRPAPRSEVRDAAVLPPQGTRRVRSGHDAARRVGAVTRPLSDPERPGEAPPTTFGCPDRVQQRDYTRRKQIGALLAKNKSSKRLPRL